jgi:hypothetical protein
MRRLVAVALVFTGLGVAYYLATPANSGADPECTIVWCKADPSLDPGCDVSVEQGWAVYFPSSPTSATAGSCSTYTMDNAYADVQFFEGGCDDTVADGTCDAVFASSSSLAGHKFEILYVDDRCFKICAYCP